MLFLKGEPDRVRFYVSPVAGMSSVLHGDRGVSFLLFSMFCKKNFISCFPARWTVCSRLCHCFCCFSDLLNRQPSVLVQPSQYLSSSTNIHKYWDGNAFYSDLLNHQPSVLLQLLQAERPSARPTLQRLHQTGGRHVQVVMMKINQN